MQQRILCAAIWCLVTGPVLAADSAAGQVDFNRDIRPILSNHCAKCHGPDAAQRQGGVDGLRLDRREAAIADLGGYAAIVPGKPDKSELIRRVKSSDDAERMPPKDAGKRLTDREIDLLTRWIQAGAPYAEHWSYVKPVRPPLPEVPDAGPAASSGTHATAAEAPANAIDRFIRARLAREGLAPAPEAGLAALLRRVSLDLTGLPPTLEDLQSFGGIAADGRRGQETGDRGQETGDGEAPTVRPDAYEAYVDKLLASPAFGEHWAHAWLDLARYADSAGYADDPPRTIWPYRDYVIQSLNANKPFDQFTIEQIAGDLLPNPSDEQLIATAFHRNTLTNNEGGTSDEEFRNVAIVDRVNTTLAVWMGTTIACAQCHNHKYDPISQEEFFRLFAFFNNTEDADRKDESPVLSWFSDEQLRQKAALEQEIAELEKTLRTQTPELAAAQQRWEREFPADELELYATPPGILTILSTPPDQRTGAQRDELAKYYADIAPARVSARKRLEQRKKQLAELKPERSVPVMRELPADKRRVTKIQHRGNFLDQGQEVSPGTPACFPPLEAGRATDRLALARWLVSPDNPLTPRVIANRFWEQVFGIGLVATSEEFGAQGDLPSHPELLDWLATELLRRHWDQKAFLRLLVTSSAYRQSSRVTPELFARDPDNRLLARGPRVRLSAETIRDQALAAGGLLSRKMYGPPVKPPQPTLGLNAAFGSGIDWQPSQGEDRYRRALYTTWRRSNPYPSMATFDAPSREVCTVRRVRTNTPLQALVTLNDPVYLEAAQSLARRMVAEGGTAFDDRLRLGFLVCLARPPRAAEASRLTVFYQQALAEFQSDRERAWKMATEPLGAPPDRLDVAELAAWTAVANVLLNLDETVLKR